MKGSADWGNRRPGLSRQRSKSRSQNDSDGYRDIHRSRNNRMVSDSRSRISSSLGYQSKQESKIASRPDPIQEKLLRLAGRSPEDDDKCSNFSKRRGRSRSRSNNNIRNEIKVPVSRSRTERYSPRRRSTSGRNDSYHLSDNLRRRSRSNSRTKSIQNNLLRLSQLSRSDSRTESTMQPWKSKSPSTDHNRNPNKVPVRNHTHPGSVSEAKTRSRYSRSRSRSGRRCYDNRPESSRKHEQSSLQSKKEVKDLSKINNRLFDLVQDQYNEGATRHNSDELDSDVEHFDKKEKKKKKKKKKKKSSTSESDDSDDSTSHKKKKRKKSKKRKDRKAEDELNASIAELEEKTRLARVKDDRNSRVPMTKEMWEAEQAVVRREFDSDTGRVRLVKGSGEILEECVSKDRQREINKQATVADGTSFQRDIKSRLGVKARLY